MNKQGLKIIGELGAKQPTVLFVAGGMTSPEVYDEIQVPAGFQSARVDWAGSEGPWAVDRLGERIAHVNSDCR